MEIVLWLAVFGVGFWLSLAAHEAGHVVVGLRHGWEVAGFYFKPAALGIGVRMGHRSTDPVDWHIGPVAVAGPVASFFAAGVFWSIEPLPDGGGVLGALAGNLEFAVINLLPTPITGGGTSPWTVRLDAPMAAHGRSLGAARARRSCAVSAVGTQSPLAVRIGPFAWPGQAAALFGLCVNRSRQLEDLIGEREEFLVLCVLLLDGLPLLVG